MSNFCGRCGPPTEADQHAKVEFTRGYCERIVPLCLDCYKKIKEMVCR